MDELTSLSNTGEITTGISNKRLAPHVLELFDILERDMDIGDYPSAEILLARLSRYFHLFDDEHVDYYQYALDVCDEMLNGKVEDDYYDDDDNYFIDWDGDALASAGFGTDENY